MLVGLPAAIPTRSLSYEQAEAAAGALAARLIASVGEAFLGRCGFVAIPRGGLFVLGMLSYLLNLERANLWPLPADRPVVVVDDGSYSGSRLAWMLGQLGQPEVIFAHLYSHPDLRAAVLQAEPRVIACVAAHDLRDHARETLPDEQAYREWQQRGRERFGDKRYWIGRPDLVIFPWTEPDRPVWNPGTGRLEEHWRLAPPDRCLGNWARLGMLPRGDVRRTLRSPDQVAFNLQDDEVLLCDLRSEEVIGLQGTAAEMWRALAAYGDPEAALGHLQTCFEVDEARLRRDLAHFIADLLSRRLLERV
ncbi:MAG: PqqD family peptide modification chaperone [Chromatiaceae bacterium]|nr:MAG: PqqD family peptide modification chaperone [Chromatiaceae bacterium]